MSLQSLANRPDEVVVVDGGIETDAWSLAETFRHDLNIHYIREEPRGVYQAMNAGHAASSGELIHYLNGGDEIIDFDYSTISAPIRIRVQICDEMGQPLWWDKISIGGYGYCHQGLIFLVGHPEYSNGFLIAADFELIKQVFPDGLSRLPTSSGGFVRYRLGGLSSERSRERDNEIAKILFSSGELLLFFKFIAVACLKKVMGKSLRRRLKSL